MSSEDMFESSEDIETETGTENTRGDTDRIPSPGPDAEDIETEKLPSDGGDTERIPSPNSIADELTEDVENLADGEEGEDRTPTKGGSAKLFRFPQGRIKQIMKMDPEVNMVNGEAIFLVNKAVEEFIQCLAVESYHNTASSKKKTIMKEHVLTAIEANDELAFLDGAMED